MIIQETVPAFSLSIVIPTLNEERALPEALSSLERQAGAPPFEVILADGGSDDATLSRFREITSAWDARERRVLCVQCPRAGRATQMNMGAGSAAGKALLFLHADTRLPEGGVSAVIKTLEDPAVVGGGFRHSFSEPGVLLRIISTWATARSRLTGIHLGDQAIFVRRSSFESIGGFPDIPLFEDLELWRRLRPQGRIVTVPLSISTSARRLIETGQLRMALRFARLEVRHALGADPARLRDDYPDIR